MSWGHWEFGEVTQYLQIILLCRLRGVLGKPVDARFGGRTKIGQLPGQTSLIFSQLLVNKHFQRPPNM